MELLAQDFHFDSHNNFVGVQKLDPLTNSYYSDLEKTQISIRVFGTKKEIEKAVNEYQQENDLMIDEVYNYEVLEKNSYWYNIFDDPVTYNKKVKENLKKYKKIYNEKNKPLIIRI